ncbi:PucR family transcriptional regulator ligand-binding domain-containing protein [Cohnella algarum]|uniref:PucR family transcriptional regulator ligand-binding domain-containing protein n=1 Tax=Cohnella algarum TaxID=2044859 RepID=UPI001F073DC3|nr:PucR family transcriptional regulator ligand-binding domain-containing protein [Cohnella algarum]
MSTMYLTVEQALSVYPLTEAKLIAGDAGKNRIVKSVNVMDAPDITDWIKEGEMLFTTAYLIKDRPEEAADLIDRLDRRGSSGLGIKLGRFWSSVPEPLVERADKLGFPLIELPFQFTFSDQMNGLFHAEMKRNTSVLQDVLDKQVRLMRFALQANPVRQLFDSVAEVIGDPIAIVGSRGKLVYNTTGLPEAELARGRPWPQHPTWVKEGGWQAFGVPLKHSERCTGYVLFFTPRMALSAIEESLYVQAAELLAFHLNFNYENVYELSVRKDFGQLVKRHLKNGLSAEALSEYADRWDIDLFRNAYRCVLTDVSGMASEAARAETLEALKEEYVCHTRLQELKGTHIVMEEGLLSLFPEAEADDGGGWPRRWTIASPATKERNRRRPSAAERNSPRCLRMRSGNARKRSAWPGTGGSATGFCVTRRSILRSFSKMCPRKKCNFIATGCSAA